MLPRSKVIKKKEKGGAEKTREKNLKMMFSAANKNRNIEEFFSQNNSVTSTKQKHRISEVQINEAIDLTTSQISQINVIENNQDQFPKTARAIEKDNDKNLSNLDVIEEDDSEKTDTEEFNYFSKPNAQDLKKFLQYHPQKCTTDNVIKKIFNYADGSQRLWPTYDGKNNVLYCFVCLAFANVNENNSFTRGFTDRKHIHTRVDEHEKSLIHKNCVEAYILQQKEANVSVMIFKNLNDKRREEVLANRKIIKSVFDVLKIVGKN
ncbi:hypothetical protein TKK_0002259 [Trichogramma kaykai]